MDAKKLVATTVGSRAVGIRRRMEGMTMRSQEESKTCKQHANTRVRGRGGGRQSLKHIDGDVPMCMRDKDKDVEMKSKEIERSRGEGGGRHRYRHAECDEQEQPLATDCSTGIALGTGKRWRRPFD